MTRSDALPLAPNPGPTPDWSARLLERGGPDVPAYGSEAWAALPDTDPRKVAATVAAAEAWRRSTHPDVVADRLTLELAAARFVAAREAEEAAALAFRAVSDGVVSRAGRPTFAELSAERGDPAAVDRALAQQDRTAAAFTGNLRASPAPERTPPGAPSTPAGRAARARRLGELAAGSVAQRARPRTTRTAHQLRS